MSYELKTDDEILTDLAQRFDQLRRFKELKDIEIVERGGANRVVLSNFRSARGGISLKTFIRLIRGLGELDRLESLLELPEQYSPTGAIRPIPSKRVRGKKTSKPGFTWGDDT